MAVQFDSVRISLEGYRKICMSAFLALGMNDQCAAEVTDNLLFADLRGTNSHGMARMKQYTTQVGKGFILAKGEPEIVSERGGALVIDGHNGLGAHTSTFAMKKTIEKAKQGGMAFCTVRNSSHYGVAAYYSMMALKEGMIGLAFTNTLPFVAHYGSMKACTGTNPLSIAFPCAKNHDFVLDMATSVVARGNIVNCAREGKEIPLGWACDKNGYPTTDPNAALTGYCLPLGADRNYKGSGICLAIDILCGLLSDGCSGLEVRPVTSIAPERMHEGPGICHAFGAIDIGYFMDPDAFRARLDAYIDELKAAPLAPGFERIYMPGEPEALKYEANLAADSVEIAVENFHEVCEICAKLCPETDPKAFLVG
jgi:LDH2 family malate/lactate/ureidoglycolate dehydrogenase